MTDKTHPIKELRKSRNKTQIEFAPEIGISQSMLSKIEDGKVIPKGPLKKIIDIMLESEVSPKSRRNSAAKAKAEEK